MTREKRQVRVGLTGGLASGKSTVARLLAEAGATVLDADRVVADLYEPGASGTGAVVRLFGDEILDRRGAVDRAALAARVFTDREAREALEEAVHPLVRERSAEILAAAEGIVVYEATLLVEAGRADDFDLVVDVEAPAETRLARAVERGLTPEEARARLEAQGDGAARRARADRRIDNTGSPEDLERAVAALYRDLERRLAGSSPRPSAPAQSTVPSQPIVLVTGNRDKLAEARRILGFELEAVAVDLPEIQSLDMTAVLRAKAEEAWQRLRRPLIVEETGLELEALNGFPGPLVKWMLEAVGAEGIARAGLALGAPGVTARCQLLYRDAEREVLAEGATRGELVSPPRGTGGFGWDPVVRPEGESLTYAELPPAAKDRLGHRGRAWRDLLPRLREALGEPLAAS